MNSELELLGAHLQLPLIDGGAQRYVNFDYAASAPPLRRVVEAVDSILPYYSSVHRGAGFKSRVTTMAYEASRATVKRFFSSRPSDAVIFTRNTTDSLNLLADSLPAGTTVVAFASEHHANLLPWRRERLSLRQLPIPESAEAAVAHLEQALRQERSDLVAVTGASNVTGEVWPIAELTQVAHSNGARIALDAAQLAPHRAIDMAELGVDYLAASGHKMYAPYGAGVLVGRPEWIGDSDPFLRGGGAVDFVSLEGVAWTDLPNRQEAGSPNVIGAVAMAEAMRCLMEYGMDRLSDDEDRLAARLIYQVRSIPEIDVYQTWGMDSEKIGVVTFNVRGFDHSKVAAILSAEYGIGVRHGCFCAHPLMMKLLNVSDLEANRLRDLFAHSVRPALPGAVRASIGLGTTQEDVDYLVSALQRIAKEGPRWTYSVDPETKDYMPVPDERPWPVIHEKVLVG